ncbi:hypothetical protein QTP70_032546 [Hemibagrus guttatus]|uniref:B30.2/SPRY domain-containing protein n=1 Tax=Hemibagrus guttatus TaxID=175788 RepID=A0AAE0ULA0_9TELE|nr:hypothetical protein QTP70_032546 [Hemibagrus guttatus]
MSSAPYFTFTCLQFLLVYLVEELQCVISSVSSSFSRLLVISTFSSEHSGDFCLDLLSKLVLMSLVTDDPPAYALQPSGPEKDLFAVKEQLRLTKRLCINASQVYSVQIAALQNQLDSMLQQLKEKVTQGPSQVVSDILQEYVKAQKLELDLLSETDPKRISEIQEQLKKSKADLETLVGNLNGIECQTANSSQNLEEKIADTLAECNELQENYNNLEEKTDNTEAEYNKLKENYEPLDLLPLIQEINKLENRIQSETSESEKKKLENELKKKKEQLEAKKKEVKDPDTIKILTIISKLEELWKFQNENLDLDSLDQIEDKREELLGLISQLNDTNLAKILLKNLVLLSDQTHLQRLISDLREKADKKIAELWEDVRRKEEELKRKNAELGQKDSDIATLTKDIRNLRGELKNLKKQLEDLEETTASQITDLQKQLDKKKQELEKWKETLQEKESELAKSVIEITELQEKLRQTEEEASRRIQEAGKRITDLKDQLEKGESENKRLQAALKKAMAECSDVQKSYDQLKAEFADTVSKLNNTLIKQALTVDGLKQEIDKLKEEIRSSEGNVDELKQRLEKKEAELKEAKKSINKWRKESLQFQRLLEDLRKVSRKQEEHIQEYLAKINRLEEEMDDLLIQLSESGNEKASLSIQVIFLKEEVAKLNKALVKLEEEQQEKTAGLEKEIEEKNKEIAYIKRSGCEELKNRISNLQQELEVKQQELNQLREENAGQITELQKQLTEKNRKLQVAKDELDKLDKENSKLLDKLDDLNTQLNEQTQDVRAAQKRISELEKQLKKKEKDILDLKNSNAECEEQLTLKQRELSDLNKDKAELEKQLKKKENELSNLNDNNAELKDQLRKKEQEISDLENNNTELQEKLKQKEKELSDLRNSVGGVKRENERLRDLVATLNEQLKGTKQLEDQLKQKEKELSDLNEKNAESEQQLRQKEEEVSELKRENAKLFAEKQNLQEDVTKLTDQLNDLRKAPVTTSPSVSINSLQFDPNTAHRRLLISDDRQSVRGVRYSIVRPNDPRRYDTTIAALAGTGFTGGRPYWEVQVKDRSCFTVGVAAESAPRKGEIYFRPSNRYWVIQKKNSQIYVLTEQPFLLRLYNQLNIIGVLIDFFKGEVALYNSETRTVLGIFRGNHFTEKLYPFVATCGQEAIQMELSSCNQRLSEKMEYSFNIEKDLSVLKEQMMLIRTLYLNSSYTSSLQTTELEDQLKNISVLEKNNTELEDQLKQKEKELSDLNEKNAESEQQLRQKEEEVSELKRENAKLFAEKQNLQEDVTKLTDQLNDLRKAPVTTSPSVSINSLQFDPNTAHRRLLISDDRQSVRGVRYSIVRPEDPRRYDTTIAALVGTGFTGGRPYWEVQVKDRSCFTVGVAAESAPRKGEIYFRPSNRYWVIQKKNSQIYVLTEQPFQLTDQLNIIGVLIDFFMGEVALYNSETRTVLGIFRENHFTEKLYPFVATCGQEGFFVFFYFI